MGGTKVSDVTTSNDPVLARESFRVYPNPVTGGTLYFSRPLSVTLFDLSGRVVARRQEAAYLPVGELPDGMYVLRTDSGETAKVVVTRP